MEAYKTYYSDSRTKFQQDSEAVNLSKEWMESGGDEKPMLRRDGSSLPGVMPSGKPVFEAFWNGITKSIVDPNGGTLLHEDDECVVIIPAGFRKAPTWNTMNPYRYEIGGESTLQSLLHILVLPKKRIDSPLSLQKEHIPLLEKMRETGRKVMKELYEGGASKVGSLDWALSQNKVVKVGDVQMSTRVKPEDLSEDRIKCEPHDIVEQMKTVRESLHVDTFSVRYLHLHIYSDEWKTIAYDKMEESAKEKGQMKNVPLDAVLEVLNEM